MANNEYIYGGEEERESFFSKLGTLKGLSEVALQLRDLYTHEGVLPWGPCSEDINKFAEFLSITRPTFIQAISKSSAAAAQEELLQLHTIMRWLDIGMPAFDLTHSLMAALLLTDPCDVDAEDVKMPFPSFAIRLPDSFWQLHGNTGNTMSAAHILVHQYLATSRHSSEPRHMLCLRIVGKLGTTSTWEVRAPIPDSGKIGEWISDDVPEVCDDTGTVVPPDENDKHIAIASRRLLVNVCLYVAAHGRGEKLGGRPSSNKKKRSPACELPEPDVWIIGRDIKLDPELITSAKAWTESKTGRGQSWKLRSKLTVIGHWRNVAHGTGHSLRTRKWIAPYAKGQGPSFIQHTYKLDEETK